MENLQIKIYPWDNDLSIYKNVEQKIVAARKCTVKELNIKETDEFLNKYHYQKSCNGQLYRYGLLYNNEIVGVMTFGKARFTTHAQYELLRLCFHPSYKVIGGSKKLFKYFIDRFEPNSIISYCDKSKFTGAVYETLKMKKIQNGLSRDHFWREKDKKHITNKQLLMFGADKLIDTNYGKGTNNKEILLKEGFVVIKDEGQDAYLYLNENQYFGYIYMTTDTTNDMKYIGQHVSSKFDPNYFGSGRIITEVIRKRKDKLKLEILEWCKQDLSEREQYWIKYYDTLFPKGYNLITNKQNFSFNDPERSSAILKAYYEGEEGQKNRKKISNILKQFYSTPEGKELAHKIGEKNKAFYKTPEGQECIKKTIQKYVDFCYTEAGEKMRLERRKKQKAYNQTKKGKIKEEKRIQSLKNFYASEEGQKAKQQQIIKYKEQLYTEEGQKKRKEQAKKYSEWAKTPEGQAALKAGAIKSRETYIKNITAKINAMSEKEWEEYLKTHPKTTLIKYRK